MGMATASCSSSARAEKIVALRYQMNGARRDMGLGRYPEIGLKEARQRALDARRLIGGGSDPIEARRAARKAAKPIPTFGEIAALVIADAQAKTTNEKVPISGRAILARPIRARCLTGPYTRSRRSRSRLFSRRFGARNPKSHGRPIQRSGACSIAHASSFATSTTSLCTVTRRIGATLRRLASRPRGAQPRASPLFALRPDGGIHDGPSRPRGCLREGARIPHLDERPDGRRLEGDVGPIRFGRRSRTVPLASLKDREHRTEPFRVPLAPRAVEIVREMERARLSRFVFPGMGGGHLSNMALLTLLKRMNSGAPKWLDTKKRKRPITAHGFRATFKTWAEEVATVPHVVVEQAMGHQVGTKVERAYRRTDLLEKRRELMNAWANYCEPREAADNVTFLRKQI